MTAGWARIQPILSTPARPVEILLGKIIPLLVLCFLALALLVGIGVFWFGVPFRGSLILYSLMALLFIFSSLGFGLLLSVRAGTQMEATQYGMVFMLVAMLFSGFTYPLNNMPVPLQVFGSIFPVTYFIRISRSVFLRRGGLEFCLERCTGIGYLLCGHYFDLLVPWPLNNAWIEDLKMAEPVILAKDVIKQLKTTRPSLRLSIIYRCKWLPDKLYGLIGPDGAGKTTTIRVLLGLLNRTAGESSILGFEWMRLNLRYPRPHHGNIAQSNVLPADLSVLERYAVFCRYTGVDRAVQKKEHPRCFIAFTGLGDFTNRLAGKLCGRDEKKLALACSLIHEPQVVFLDEPTLGVDPVSRREFWNLLGNLRTEQGLTIFMSTPYMDEADAAPRLG